MAFFYIQHHRQEDAILPPRVTISRNVLFGLIFSSANNGGLSIIEYYVSLSKHLLEFQRWYIYQ
jgi:hypothetical protein